jgi:RND family efflux transporter MFP subunit
MAPVYVTFMVPQRTLPDVRQALAAESATIEAIVPGEQRQAAGQVTMIDNMVDSTSGMVAIRATMPNADGLLWPGTLVTARLTLRTDHAVAVPSTAIQVSQTGSHVFVVDQGVANVRPVKVLRVHDDETVIGEGLAGGETVVTDGQLLLSDGTRVSPREPKIGS